MTSPEQPELVIRRASRGDLDLVLSVDNLFRYPPTAEWTRDFLDNGSNLLLLALQDGVPVGMLVAVETGYMGASPDLFVYGIRVSEPLRGRGIAHRLVDKARDIAEEAGCRSLWGSMQHDRDPGADSPLTPPEATTGAAGSTGSTQSTTFVIPIP
ncbi:GCN5 family acetyltransferase [Dietzia sp. UCD-THP]|uniref:GNAT family N-acetyltransferase n=1 Tax=Dietzia sp. UCD-THP TaxID=1292020 RepID=UPI00035C0F7B|nr:GNAT family N-acetyltransferase [Dietzia sp. UCD-THP]EYT56919.1 GCN5 family acetyltransferase [Dietzia sp. UCD-THP]